MKALKYGIVLCIGLCMAGTPVLAQSAGQSKEVTPKTPNNLQDLPPAVNDGQPQQESYRAKGMHVPSHVSDLLSQGNYAQAVEALEVFVKKQKGDPCDIAFMRFLVYWGIRRIDPQYEATAREAMNFMETKCANQSDVYVLKVELFGREQPEKVMDWLNKAIEVEPFADIYTLRGETLWWRGEHKKACADYKQAMELGDTMGKEKFLMNHCEDILNQEGEGPAATPAQ